jgi:hypothetical protein
LYVAGLLDGFIRRIDNPEDDPSTQTVDVVAVTQAQKNGQVGRGINGSMGMLGDNLYLPEDGGFTVVRNASTCGINTSVCATATVNIGTFGEVTGSAIAVDPNPQHSTAGLVYASESPDAARATIYQYDVATNSSRLYTSSGQMPPAGTAAATAYCTLTCQGPTDPKYPLGDQATFRFAQGLFVDPTTDDGTLYITEDSSDGNRAERGHIWATPFVPFSAGTGAAARHAAVTTGATCAISVSVPALRQGDSYWVQFDTHASGQISSSWEPPVEQSAQLVLHSGNPYAGGADPVSATPGDSSLARQVSSNSTKFAVTTAPNAQQAGTYAAQFYNGGKSFGATTAEITYQTSVGTVCPASPLTGHVVN